MTVIIGIVCFTAGALLGFFWASAFSLAKQVDEEMEDENGN
jgi:uncharacterized protein YneF (UPF0154 family)